MAEWGVAADLAGPGVGEIGAQPGRFRRGRTCCVTPPEPGHRSRIPNWYPESGERTLG